MTRSSAPAEKPLLVYDGDCYFCLRWLRRWQETTQGAVDVAPFQSVGARFAEDIPAECFQSAVRLIETDGRVSGGPEAISRMLTYAPGAGRGLALWFYETLPGYAPAARLGYGVIARQRKFASFVTTALWGKAEDAVCRPTYYSARRWFLRILGLVYLIAFGSLWIQIDGLIGHEGITPLTPWLQAVRDHFGQEAYRLYPTVFWLNSSDGFLQLICGAGVVLSLVLIVQIAPAVCLLLLWALYLSLSVAGQVFLNFQWDYLLLEAGFFSIFLAPLRLFPSRRGEPRLSRWALFLLLWLLFRLMFMSGLVKLTSGDESWWNLSALLYHYETQPLPTPLAWWAHQLPAWFHATSVVVMFSIELGAPFLLFGPRRLRLIGVTGLLILQALIALTGNYCFFNLLAAGLCLLAIDDAVWPHPGRQQPVRPTTTGPSWPPWILIPVTVFVLGLSGPLLWNAFLPEADFPPLFAVVYGYVEPFRSLNGYGLFRVMTRTRPEIVVEGSPDGVNWRPYEFKYKVGDPRQAPPIVAPHQPRLDWQMWFAALADVRQEPWFVNFLVRLLQGSPPVLRLLKENPFPDAPPRYVRARLFQYHFTDITERNQTGAWWKREEEGLYCPALSLRSANE